jgi:hypothetical protein
MAVELVVKRIAREPFANLPVEQTIGQLCAELAHEFRDRVFTPLVTLRTFVLQIVHRNTSITHLRHLAGFDFAPSSYSDARDRLPLPLLQGILRRMKDWAADTAADGLPPLLGGNVYVVDGSSATTSDAPGLRETFGLPPGQKPGIGYPMARIMGLLDAVTGLFVQMLARPLFTHDLRGVIGLHPNLKPGDKLVGDRAFCSMPHFCLLAARGVFGCFRLHQRRKDHTPGWQLWKKPPKCPDWMTAEQFATLPGTIRVRVVVYTLERNGFRTSHFRIATTLPEAQWSDEAVAALYGRRWPIETCFGHIKTTLGMDQLKCKSVERVLKELAVFLIVYNLVRILMLKAARLLGVCVDRISFIDVLRALASWMTGSTFTPRPVVNPRRKRRRNPRVVRRRKKQYDMMNKTRETYRQELDAQAVGACPC